MKRVGCAPFLAFGLLLDPFLAAGAPAETSPEMELTAKRTGLSFFLEAGTAQPVAQADRYFSAAPELGLGVAICRTASRWRLPLTVAFWPTLDPSPASSVWFLGVWLHPELTLRDRFVGSVGLGWDWRHISIDSASSTSGAPSGLFELGVRFHPRERWEVTAFGRYVVNAPVRSEQFAVQHVVLAVSLALRRSR